MRAEQYRAIRRTSDHLYGLWGAQGQSKNTRDRVVDAHCTIVTGSSNPGSTGVTYGSHVREASWGVCDGSQDVSPIVRTPVEHGHSCFLWEGYGVKHR